MERRYENEGPFDHVTFCRDRQEYIFLNYQDREDFLGILETVQSRYKWLVHAFRSSMGRNWDCRDNSVVESAFGSLNQERVHWRNYQTRHAAQQNVMGDINTFYNLYRLHSYLGYVSPNKHEKKLTTDKKTA